MKWNPVKVIERHTRAVVRRAVAAIQSAAPPVPHRDGANAIQAGPGGSFVKRISQAAFVEVKRWGTNTKWSTLGQEFHHFVRGTSRQKARPIDLLPNVPKLVADLRADALAHFKRRAQGRAA